MNQSEDSSSHSEFDNDLNQGQQNIQTDFLESPINQPLQLEQQSPNFLDGSYLQANSEQIDDFKLENNSQKDDEFQSHDELNSFNKSKSMKSFQQDQNSKILENVDELNLDFKEKKTQDTNIDQQNVYQIDINENTIQVIHQRVEKQIKVTHYFSVKGSLILDSQIKNFETEKRFSDFYLLDKILQSKYYYKILPQLPEKNISILITSNTKQLKQRVEDLNYYLKQMIKINEIKTDNIFQIFLFQHNNFQDNQTIKADYVTFCNSEKLLSQFLKSAQIWKKQLTNNNKFQFEEPYRLLIKQIGSQQLYVQTIIENFSIIKKNFNQMIRDIIKINNGSQQIQTIEQLEQNQKQKKNLDSLKNLIQKYKNILKVLESCKVAIQKRQQIYSQQKYIQNELLNETKNVQRVIELQIQDEKYQEMTKKIEELLQHDLINKQQQIKQQLIDLSQSSIKPSFQTFFSFNQLQLIQQQFIKYFLQFQQKPIVCQQFYFYQLYQIYQAKLITDLDVFSINFSSVQSKIFFLLHMKYIKKHIKIKIIQDKIMQTINSIFQSSSFKQLKLLSSLQNILSFYIKQKIFYIYSQIFIYYFIQLFDQIQKDCKKKLKNDQQMIQILAKTKFDKNQQIKVLPISVDISIKDLKKLIQINFGIIDKYQKLTIKQNNYQICLIETFTLEFYCVQNNQEIYIDIIQEPNSHFKSSMDLKKLSSQYNPSFIEQTLKLFRKQQQQVWNSIYAHNFILSLNKEYQISKETDLYNLSNDYFKVCKNLSTENIDEILNRLQKLEKNDLEKIINQRDSLGWPGILYAIRNQLDSLIISICQISKGKILDCQSHDGWTVLSYCTFQKNWKLLYKILKYATQKQVQIETSKGSLSHYILKYSPDYIFLETIFNKLIDPNLIDSQQQQALYKCCQRRQEQIQYIMKIINIPFKPFGIIDKVQKNYFFRGWQDQYLKLDFDTLSLQVFNHVDDIPFVMKRIIPFQQLKDVKFYQYKNKIQQFQYMKFSFNQKQHEYRIVNERVQIWKEVLNRFTYFSEYYKNYVAQEQNQYKLYIQKYWEKIISDYEEYQVFIQEDYDKIYKKLFKKKIKDNKKFHVNIFDFHYLQKIGSGAFANVFKVIHKKSKKIFALKTINKNNLIKSKTKKFAQIEKKILQENNKDSFLITLHFSFQNNQFLYIVEDYCKNGDIESLLNSQPDRTLPIDIVRIYSAQILLALEELHNRNYIYRDLKPENILIDDHGYIKIADFGLCAQNIKLRSQYSKTFCGTPYYLSPEMIIDKQSYKVSDFFSFGVLIYELIRGIPPFTGLSKDEIYDKIINYPIKLDTQYFNESSIDLISKLTDKNPMTRIGYESIEDIFNHEFFQSINWQKLRQRQIPPPIQFDNSNQIEQEYEFKSTNMQSQQIDLDKNKFFENFNYINTEYEQYYK